MPNDQKYPNLKGTLFIVTYGRSGSTLLLNLLHTIPGAQIMGENYGALEPLFLAGQRIRRTSRTWGKKDHPPHHPWYGASALKPNRFERKLVSTFVDEVLQPTPDTRWSGFKEIRYPALGDRLPQFLEFCQRNFHNPFFVFNSRNAADVAQSKWWARKPKEEVYALVEAADAHFAAYVAANPSHAHHIFYDEIVKDSDHLRPLFEKLDEPFDLDRITQVLGHRLQH